MKMNILSGGRLRMKSSVYYPDAPKDAMSELPVSCILIRHPQGNLLFDTGCSPEAATDPAARWGGIARFMIPAFDESDTLPAQLPKVGLTPDDIDVVVCSHLHPDHCGCNAAFRRATVVAHAAELAAAAEQGAAAGYLSADWDHGQKTDAITEERDLFGDGRVVLIPTPGHTPGMTIAKVGLDRDGEFILASDAAPVRGVLDGRYAPRNSWDVEKTVAALDLIAALRDKGATVIHGHDDAQWLELKTGADTYE